ncbi:putative 2-aminoethylphosphonate ABC transporter permease subunit [Gloeocapsa sp. PCC 73106]|uniref:putative 2-aminoethylphosphonate ABC transporter permease subunit n=1 Tax=Gloeocapsa sp. PCC 73106 TaxID=102232 RepID=UPI0002ACB2A2|nr:putative 2-aminoethylphosphonate ABC transporter permease subunit [Gloeocapsa sp. PCC 73106]ELR98106.1 putative 2-aminoethylphosphonate ABC transporter, permease protein [Gloeocapsa sp. PCC 73106]
MATTTKTKTTEIIKPIATGEDWIRRVVLGLSTLWLLLGVVFPLYAILSRSFQDRQGNWIGLQNFIDYLNNPNLVASFFNSFYIAIVTTIISVFLAFIFAYGLTRTAMPGKRVFNTIGMLPLYIPPLAHAIALIYLFGRQGIVTRAGWDINLYGPNGIIIGEVLYCFPQALVILITALSLTDARLYEAALALRTPQWRTFLTVTLPGVKYGLISAIFVCFILAFTDFGVPKVVGGNFNVLATDIYRQVIGQQNFPMGATISVFLLIPTIIAFVVDRIIQRRQTSSVSAKAVPFEPKPNKLLDSLVFMFCTLVILGAVTVFATIILASLIGLWPRDLYNFQFTLNNFDFSRVAGGGYSAYMNSIIMSLLTAVFGTIIVFIGAYLVEKGKGLGWLRFINYFLSTIPLALPGLVIGLGYLFFFVVDNSWGINNGNLLLVIPNLFTGGQWVIPNPFGNRSMALLVVCNIIHFYTVCFLTANTALKQLDPEFESVSASMSVPFYKTFWRVTLPMSLPTILGIGIYYFVNAMVTVSAIIFLRPSDTNIAAISIINMDDAGDIGAAAAMSTLLVVTSLGVRALYWLFTKGIERRSQAWLKR